MGPPSRRSSGDSPRPGVGRPLALETAQRAASLGAKAGAHAESLATGEAPDFTLPDLAGQMHTLSSFRGKKVLLIAYASW